jgi:translocation and assembly module TamA
LTDQSFMRFYSRLQHFLPIGQRDLILLHGEGGAVFTKGSNDDVPASLLFRAGGTESIRGYSYQSIGNLQDGTVFPTKFLMTTGAEYQHWFNGQWGGALFYDVGTATDNWSDRVIYQGIGVGARWHSPVGPVNVDLAYGERVERVRLHLSLGVAF